MSVSSVTLKNTSELFQNVLLGSVDNNGVRSPKWTNQIALAAIIVIVITFFVEFIRYVIVRYQSYKTGSPLIVSNMKNAKKDLVITQDTSLRTSIPLKRSLNETEGIEFSYTLWMFIDDLTYKQGTLKNVFCKGTYDFQTGTMCPALFIDKNTNTLLLFVNTYSEPYVVKEITNIPLNKWFHVSIVLKNQNVDIFINGLIKKRMTLPSLPKQNFSDLYINRDGGYSGYLSRMRYYNYAITYAQVEGEVSRGPSLQADESSMTDPPYLSSAWFINSPI